MRAVPRGVCLFALARSGSQSANDAMVFGVADVLMRVSGGGQRTRTAARARRLEAPELNPLYRSGYTEQDVRALPRVVVVRIFFRGFTMSSTVLNRR